MRRKKISQNCYINTIQFCLSDELLREVVEDTIAAELWTKLKTLYMTKSINNRLYLKHQLYTLQMKECVPIKDRLDGFNRVILDLQNIKLKVEDKNQTLNLLKGR